MLPKTRLAGFDSSQDSISRLADAVPAMARRIVAAATVDFIRLRMN
jgi:hypothetical protein